MLTQIDLRNFKCFEALKLPLSPLTLLSGTNASGKSSILQAFVLMHQTMREHEWSSRLMLNGSALRLGTVADVTDQLHGRIGQRHGHRAWGISLADGDDSRYEWQFIGATEDMSMALDFVRGDSDHGEWEKDGQHRFRYLLPHELYSSPAVASLSDRLRDLAYLTAERLGPREFYSLEDPQLTPVVGSRGEHAISILHTSRDELVLNRLVKDGTPPTLIRQTEAHMRVLFPHCEISVEEIPGANAVKLGLRTSRSVDSHRPLHTGFGLTQVLPIVVAALSRKEDGLLLVENPEIHLHPAGQAAMGEFLTWVATAGVQVILETHSDHVLNGVRRAVRDEIVPPEDVALYFIRSRYESERNDTPQIERPMLDVNGNIDNWPEGFFDQFERDINYFAGWS